MKSRILTALVLIPPVIYVIGWGPKWLFFLVLLAVVERSLCEYFAISRQAGFKPFSVLGYAAAGVVCGAQFAELRSSAPWVMILLVLIVFVTLSWALVGAGDVKDYLGAASSTLLGVVYVGFTLPWLVPLRFSQELGVVPEYHSGKIVDSRFATGRELLLFLFVVIWAGDVLAFFVGKAVGRRALFPRVSPNKTVEGAVAGFLGSLLVGWLFARRWWTADAKMVVLVAGLVAIAGQVGDLAESALKRGANVKDSGALLPGHGGMLDRIDSLLFGAPALWLALTMIRLTH